VNDDIKKNMKIKRTSKKANKAMLVNHKMSCKMTKRDTEVKKAF